MFQFCTEHFSCITFQKITADDINLLASKHDNRFKKSTLVPCTRSFHFFNPLSKTVTAVKIVSNDNSYSLIHSLDCESENLKTEKNSYACAAYDITLC